MVEESSFRGALGFFGKIGVYDVLLPFLLVFTIVYAVLDKSRILGTDKVGNEELPRRNLNSMVAFCIAFFVVASTEVVRIISETMANVVLLLMISFAFLMLVGTFVGQNYTKVLKRWNWFFILSMLVGVVLIFANSIYYGDKSWLEWFWNYVVDNWNQEVVGSIILLAVIVGIMFRITKGEKPQNSDKDKDKEEE